MNTRARWQLTAGLILAGLLAAVQSAVAGSFDPNRTVTVHIRNYANVDHETLIEAEKVADTVYRHVGVELQWTGDSSLAPPDSDNQKPRGLTDIELSIIPASMSDRLHMAKTVMGFAPGSGRDRTAVYIFYGRVQEFEARLGQAAAVTSGQLLGHVISHEMGHLLLNLEAHTQAGIMRGKWDLQDFQDAACGTLLFSRDQAAVIRSEVSRRQTLAQISEVTSR